jgi:hypothetical protein
MEPERGERGTADETLCEITSFGLPEIDCWLLSPGKYTERRAPPENRATMIGTYLKTAQSSGCGELRGLLERTELGIRPDDTSFGLAVIWDDGK